jgi:hypothetical protein
MADNESAPAGARRRPTYASRRTSFNLSEDAERVVRELAQKRGVSMGEVIRRALSTEKFLTDKHAAGAKILIQEPDKTLREVVIL